MKATQSRMNKRLLTNKAEQKRLKARNPQFCGTRRTGMYAVDAGQRITPQTVIFHQPVNNSLFHAGTDPQGGN